MIGYVDRIDGWRIFAWLLAGISPVVVTLAIINGLHVSSSLIVTIPILLGALVATVVTWTLSYEALAVKRPISIQLQPIENRSERTVTKVRAIYRHPRTRTVLSIVGALLVGIVGSELANVIPWPWG